MVNGFTLIEVLIGLTLFGLVLLGLNGSLVAGFKKTKEAYYFSVADEQWKSMKEYLVALRGDQFEAYLTLWNKENRQLLPRGEGVVLGRYPRFLVKISWGSLPIFQCKETKIGASGCLYQSFFLG